MRDIAEQKAAGRAARKRLPRWALGEWAPIADRDPVAVVRVSEEGRIPELIPIRRERMRASPFGFYRGAAAVMAADLIGRPNSGLEAQICGDAHVLNLGAYASPEGHLVFDINDFDETARAPFEWDLLRFAASLVLAGREAGDSDSRCTASVAAFVRAYREAIAAFATLPFVERLRVDIKRIVTASPIDRVLAKAERATSAVLAKKLIGDDSRFREEPPLLRRLGAAEKNDVLASLGEYERTLTEDRRFGLRQYMPVDAAFKVVGTGSVGLKDYIVFFRGASADDVLFLQVKEERPSCYAPDAAIHQGQRVVEGQRLMQRSSDPFLGWTTIAETPFLVRQLNDHKAAAGADELKGRSLIRYAEVAGAVIARGHARSGEAAAIAAYCGRSDKLDRAVARFAVAYADQTVADHAQFLECGGLPPL